MVFDIEIDFLTTHPNNYKYINGYEKSREWIWLMILQLKELWHWGNHLMKHLPTKQQQQQQQQKQYPGIFLFAHLEFFK